MHGVVLVLKYTRELFCSALVGENTLSTVTAEGPYVPWLYNKTNGCRDSFGPASDGYYEYSEMHWLAWLAHASVCGGGHQGCQANDPIEKFWQAWQGRANAPSYRYAGRELLTLWPSYVVQLPYYLVHAFNADSRFQRLLSQQWQAVRHAAGRRLAPNSSFPPF